MRMNVKKRFSKSVLFALILIIAAVLIACGNNTAMDSTQPTVVPEPVETGSVVTEPVETGSVVTEQPKQMLVEVQTKYMMLGYPESYIDVLSHQEAVSDTVAMEIFSLNVKTGTLELFRIYFGDETVGSIAGYLDVDGSEVPVTYTVCQYNDDEFADEDTRTLYYETMNCFNDIMSGMLTDERFHIEKEKVQEESATINLSYWSVTLPVNMECEEFEEDGQYKVSFYGNVAGERIALYTIYLGDTGAETVLGVYNVNGEKRLLSLESFEIVPAAEWTDEDQEAAFGMLATINNVLQTIMSSENFSEQIPE